ncbi:SusC/RagA family TonB-linked outer membrane protein [Bacteroides reticulotermitis]|uniref:TonB-linked SusC/RagA family outer membrane protein n=1 Tax=Bacteroides reticulotermitis TaxID=1133319 RepID=A0A840D9U4_9BACE|nr:TonB-dependent receptor [Bacteroides reticulotermitis]MBB4045162.1 TonB-linked SusC/RagA family outer membrane protein [Bacteroides reticulotermitis]
MIRKFLSTCLLLLGFSVCVLAQENIVVTGIVTDTNKEPIIGVNVSIADMPGLGAITDIYGKYMLKMPPYHKLIFTSIGYDKLEVLVKEQRVVNVVMKESEATSLDEVVITGTGVQRKIAVTGAITNVDVEELKSTPSSSMADALAGVVPGIQAMQSNGRPGTVSEFWIRSISTFGANSSALVLVDGFERDLNEVNVEDVESFSVLKDASATAIYGSKGANGVILINTRRGKEGKININAKIEGFYSMPTKLPDFANGYTYASMANEAKIARNQEPLYQQEELDVFRLGLDPDIYPDVDWMDLMLRKTSQSSRASLNMTGGGKTARYYVGGSYQNQQGIYKTDKSLKDYNTNANFQKWTYRMNVDIDITQSTLLQVGVSGSLRKQNDPGVGTNAIWTALMGINPILMPIEYSNGYIPANKDNDDNNDNDIDRFNPYTQATQTGYNESWQNNIQTNVTLEQKLDFITKGLKFIGRFGYDTENSNWIKRVKWPEMWTARSYRESDGTLNFDRAKEEQKMTQSSGSNGLRNEFFEWEMHYNRGFKDHHTGAVIKYTQSSKVFNQGIGTDLKNGVARRNQGLAGRVNYNWMYRYFIDFNFGYTGSENFHRDNRFGFFPAVSGAWNVAEESFIKNNLKWVNMFKIRYSWGKTGNDNLGDIRFPYLYTIETMMTDETTPKPTGGYQFADPGYDRYYGGMRYSNVASANVSWEISTKQDLGIDFSLFDDKLTGEVDYYKEKREGIYLGRDYLPWITGLESTPSANVGIVKTEGFDGRFSFKHKLDKVNLTIRGNVTYGKNEIVERDEENSIYWYKKQAGHRVNQAMGLVALGLFKDYEEIRNWPSQFGELMPGDIKYKDINGDGVIDDNDRVAIGATTKPNFTYGFGISAQWKGLDVNVHFQGVGKSSYFINGSTVYMFSSGDWGNIMQEMAEGNRWILGVNEDPNADYPRLTYGNNSNNNRASTFWLRDGAYLRLKTLDVGYSLPKSLVRKAHMNTVRFFFTGTNLLTFSKFKLWDPEMGSSTGKTYPLTKTLSLGVSVNL